MSSNSRQSAYDEIFRRPKPQYQPGSYQPDYPPGAQAPYQQQQQQSHASTRRPGAAGGYPQRPSPEAQGSQRSSYYPPQDYGYQQQQLGYSSGQQGGPYQQGGGSRTQSSYHPGSAYTSPEVQQGPWQGQLPTHYSAEPGVAHPEQQRAYTSPRSSYAPTMSSGPSSASTSSLYSRPSVSSATSVHYPHSSYGHNGSTPAASLSPTISPVASISSLPPPPSAVNGPPQLPVLAHDDFFGFESSRPAELREGEQVWSGQQVIAAGSRGGSPGSLYDPGQYDDSDRPASVYSAQTRESLAVS